MPERSRRTWALTVAPLFGGMAAFRFLAPYWLAVAVGAPLFLVWGFLVERDRRNAIFHAWDEDHPDG